MGEKIDEEVLKEAPLIPDAAAQAEIDRLGQGIVKNGGLRRPEIEYHFKIIKSEDFNAFSVPGGYIYFTEPLWNALRTDERAGVLAHEIVHSDRRHVIDAMSKYKKRSTILGAILVLAGVNKYIRSAADIANNLSALSYSRGDEEQADSVGTEMLIKSGMNPAGLLLAMRKLPRLSGGPSLPTILSTHPNTGARVTNMQNQLKNHSLQVPPDDVVIKRTDHMIGAVTGVAGDIVSFTTSRELKDGETVWLIGSRWDEHYETLLPVPLAKVVVTRCGRNQAAGRLFPGDKKRLPSIKTGTEISAPAIPSCPDEVKSVAVLGLASTAPGSGFQIKPDVGRKFEKGQRLLAMDVVWDKEVKQLKYDCTGMVMITNPDDPAGLQVVSSPKYPYVSVSPGAVLVECQDQSNVNWVGTVVSVGAVSQQVEIATCKKLERYTRYKIVRPEWACSSPEEHVLIAEGRYSPQKGKVVLQIVGVRTGLSMSDIKCGFDVYDGGEGLFFGR